MKNSGKKLSLTSYDDIFTTENARQEDQRERVMEIPLDKLQHFHDHPFQVRHDQALQDMADSIKEYGVLSPGLARPLSDGSGYEVISGNRRLEACILAGMETMPVIVRDGKAIRKIPLTGTSSTTPRNGDTDGKSFRINIWSLPEVPSVWICVPTKDRDLILSRLFTWEPLSVRWSARASKPISEI